ncbi:MAG: hypothetical protein JWO06_59, partial [Bacteroidota bacterium]|nr:hypothetical protein [Bacteroidota bacterium]
MKKQLCFIFFAVACFIQPSRAQYWNWAIQSNGAGNFNRNMANAVATDSHKNIYVTGQFA